jgi:diadenosine tetraphosphate (Ap4A) HIT family hydrolase
MNHPLDPRLATDSQPVISLALCDVRLMDDARYPWLLLVPRIAGLVEVTDLAEPEQQALWREVHAASLALRQVCPCEKINIGALGNIVRQLHVHVVARSVGDAAWPGPVWGHGKAEAYAPALRDGLVERLRMALVPTGES